jgi:hypothetical protein
MFCQGHCIFKKSFRGLVNSDATDPEAVRAVVVVARVDATSVIEVQIILVDSISLSRPVVAVRRHIVDLRIIAIAVAPKDKK